MRPSVYGVRFERASDARGERARAERDAMRERRRLAESIRARETAAHRPELESFRSAENKTQSSLIGRETSRVCARECPSSTSDWRR